MSLLLVLSGISYSEEVQLDATAFPPLYFPTTPENSARPGVSSEILDLVNQKLGFTIRATVYPPARVFQRMDAGETEMTLLFKQIAQRYRSSFLCTTDSIIEFEPSLYQNREQESELRNIRQELKGKVILVARPILQLARNLLPPQNELQGIHLVELLPRMFRMQRENYVLDFQIRFDYLLQQEQLTFAYHRYPLTIIKGVACIHKNVPKAKQKLISFAKASFELRETEAAKAIYAKYGVSLDFFLTNSPVPTYQVE